MRNPYITTTLVTGKIALISILAAILAMNFAFSVDSYNCGELHGENAPGGGAVIGMYVLIVIGTPSILWVIFSETLSVYFKPHAKVRFISVLLPSIITVIWMMHLTTKQCA